MTSIFIRIYVYNKNGWSRWTVSTDFYLFVASRWTVSTDFYLFVASHDARALLLRLVVLLGLLLGESYLPEPWRVILYLDEAVLLDALDDRIQVSRCPFEVDEEDLERPLSRVVGLVKSCNALDLGVVDDVVEDFRHLLRCAAIKSVADAERRNGHGGRHSGLLRYSFSND